MVTDSDWERGWAPERAMVTDSDWERGWVAGKALETGGWAKIGGPYLVRVGHRGTEVERPGWRERDDAPSRQ